MIRRLAASFCVALLATSCANTVEGTPDAAQGQAPTSTSTSAQTDTAWIASMLPDATELSRTLGARPPSYDIEPLVGDATDLRNTIIGSDVTEPQCVGVVAPLETRTFETAPVSAVAYVTLPEATVGVVSLSSDTDARSLFSAFAEQWQQCNGKTVVKSDGVGTYDNEISRVDATDSVLSATVTMSTPSTGMRTQTQRTLGVAEDCIVDVEVRVTGAPTNSAGLISPATELVQAMLANVRTARR